MIQFDEYVLPVKPAHSHIAMVERSSSFIICYSVIWSERLNRVLPYGCFRKWWYPQIIHFNRVFHYFSPSILGYHHFRKPQKAWRIVKRLNVHYRSSVFRPTKDLIRDRLPTSEKLKGEQWKNRLNFGVQHGDEKTTPCDIGTGDFLKWWYPTTMGFPYYKWSFWGVLGVPSFKETPK